MLGKAPLARILAALILASVAAELGGSASAGDGLRMRQDAACRGEAICPGDRSPVWSPDGRTIAFVRYLPRRGGKRVQALYSVPARGGPARQLYAPAGSPVSFEGLTWSPDGSRLAFAAGGIWTLAADGGVPVRITSNPPAESRFFDGGPAWSPDGRTIAFVRVRDSGARAVFCCELWLTGADGSGPRRVAGGFGAGEAAAKGSLWSPAGDLAYVVKPPDGDTFSEVWLLRADGRRHRVLHLPGFTLVLAGWSADGARLIFVAYEASRLARKAMFEAVNVDGSDRRPLVDGGPCCGLLSPDATQFIREGRSRDGGAEIVVHDLDGGQRRIPDGVSRQAVPALTSASWSPDGTQIAYVADGECPTLIAVHTVRADGSDARRLTQPCRRVGTPGHDRLRGTAGPQALYGRGGADVLDGGLGPDNLQGEAGADRVDGGLGDDRLYGGPGRDRLFGGDGWDAIYARDGMRDLVTCGPGRDAVRADRHDVVARDCEVIERG